MKSTGHKSRKRQDDHSLNDYAVAFFDILGQQDALKKMAKLTTESSKEEALVALMDAHGAVIKFRQRFEGFYKEINNFDFSEIQHSDDLPSEMNEFLMNLKQIPIETKTFSDCLTAFVSLPGEQATYELIGMHGLILSAAHGMLWSLAEQMPIRGGVDVGLGMKISDSELYGPSLSSAYGLESKISEYPRVIVGKGLMEYLEPYRMLPSNTYPNITNKCVANKIMKMIAKDIDGFHVVDYLGEAVRKNLRTEEGLQMFKAAYEFVIKEENKWSQSEDIKLKKRYALLLHYFERNEDNWI